MYILVIAYEQSFIIHWIKLITQLAFYISSFLYPRNTDCLCEKWERYPVAPCSGQLGGVGYSLVLCSRSFLRENNMMLGWVVILVETLNTLERSVCATRQTKQMGTSQFVHGLFFFLVWDLPWNKNRYQPRSRYSYLIWYFI